MPCMTMSFFFNGNFHSFFVQSCGSLYIIEQAVEEIITLQKGLPSPNTAHQQLERFPNGCILGILFVIWLTQSTLQQKLQLCSWILWLTRELKEKDIIWSPRFCSHYCSPVLSKSNVAGTGTAWYPARRSSHTWERQEAVVKGKARPCRPQGKLLEIVFFWDTVQSWGKSSCSVRASGLPSLGYLLFTCNK